MNGSGDVQPKSSLGLPSWVCLGLFEAVLVAGKPTQKQLLGFLEKGLSS